MMDTSPFRRLYKDILPDKPVQSTWSTALTEIESLPNSTQLGMSDLFKLKRFTGLQEPGMDWFNLTPAEMSVQRFRGTNRYAQIGDRFGKPITLLVDIWRGEGGLFARAAEKLEHLINLCGNPYDLYQSLKDMSDEIILSGLKVTGMSIDQAMQLCYLHTLGGFASKASEDTLILKLKEWVEQPFVPTFNGSEDEFNKMFALGVEDFFRYMEILGDKQEFVTLDQYINEPMRWATPGATQGQVVKVDGKKVRSKNASSLRYTKDEIRSKILTPKDKYVNKIFQKGDEIFGKTRLVSNSDFALYLKMSFVCAQFENRVKHQYTSLWWKVEDKLQDLKDFSASLNGHDWAVPADYSEFDHRVSLSMLKLTWRGLVKWLNNIGWNDNDGEVVAKQVEDSFDRMWVQLGDGSKAKYLKCEKGVLSGWKVTALFDTIINYAVNFIFREEFKAIRGQEPFNLKVMKFQGDDQNLVTRSKEDGELYIAFINAMGFKIHATKTWASRDHGEYLRLIYTEKGVYGYGNRLLRSIFLGNPVSMPPPMGMFDRLRVTASNWIKFSVRTGFDILQWLTKDLRSKSGWKMEDIRQWMFTGKSLGGLGLNTFRGQVGFKEKQLFSRRYNELSEAGGLVESYRNFTSKRDLPRKLIDKAINYLGFSNVNFGGVERVEVNTVRQAQMRWDSDTFFENNPWHVEFRSDLIYSLVGNFILEETDKYELEKYIIDGFGTYRMLREKMSSKVFENWVAGKLQPSGGTSLVLSEEAISNHARRLWNSACWALTTKNHITNAHINAISIGIEELSNRITTHLGHIFRY